MLLFMQAPSKRLEIIMAQTIRLLDVGHYDTPSIELVHDLQRLKEGG
jgi:hypothetical protein